MFASMFATIRETLMGLFTQQIVDVISSLFGGLHG
jgi:hypothetical protein